MHPLPVPLVPGGGVEREAEVEVADERVEAAVAHHRVEVRAEGLARLAGDLLGAGDEVVEAVVLLQPLRRGLGADAGHPWQVVAGLPHEGGQLGVARGGNQVLLGHRLGRHPGQVRDPLARVEHRRRLIDQLERVPVTRAQEHLSSGLSSHRGDGGEDVGTAPGQRTHVPRAPRVERGAVG